MTRLRKLLKKFTILGIRSTVSFHEEDMNRIGASITKGREKITAWASLDGGRTWPVKRLVYDGPAGYSNLAAGRVDTPSQGRIYMLFEGGPDGPKSAIQVVAFNLSWLLDGRDLSKMSSEPAEPRS